MVKQMPLYIKVNDRDNVAIVANAGGLTKGTRFPCGLTLMEDIPQGHKVALADFREGDPIVRYGEVIGYAQKRIQKGEWVKESSIRLPHPPDLHQLPIATKTPVALPPLEGYTFQGYRNADGSFGTRNLLPESVIKTRSKLPRKLDQSTKYCTRGSSPNR
ncbi:hypothetical protein ABH20_14490 [Geobacillus sp. T6]|nr:hypothetical protein ABH20_14490 [Geobacillus sp. T6]